VASLGASAYLAGIAQTTETVRRVMDERRRVWHTRPPYGIDVVGALSLLGLLAALKPFGSVGGSIKVSVNMYHPIIGDNKPYDPKYITRNLQRLCTLGCKLLL
jgi:hypothetical protein